MALSPDGGTLLPLLETETLMEILVNPVPRVEFTDGRFAQSAGWRFVW